MKPKRLLYIDILRACSAILIVIYHFPYQLGTGTDFLHGTVNGSWGMTPVFSFFMLSGASLFLRYENDPDFSILDFYQKRLLRLFPLFWISYLLGFFLLFWVRGGLEPGIPWYAIFWSFIGMDGWIHNWTPTYYVLGEWFMGSILILYALFPLYLKLWKKHSIPLFLTIAGLTALLYWYHPFPMEIKQNPVVDSFFFLTGILLVTKHNRFFSSARHLVIAGICCGLILLATIFIPFARIFPTMELSYLAQVTGPGIFLRHCYNTVQTLSFYITGICLTPLLAKSHLLVSFLKEVGKKSYGIFLTHHLIGTAILLPHFGSSLAGGKNLSILMLLTFTLTWCATLMVYSIEAHIARLMNQKLPPVSEV